MGCFRGIPTSGIGTGLPSTELLVEVARLSFGAVPTHKVIAGISALGM